MLAMLPRTIRLAGRRRIPLAALADETWTAPSRDHLSTAPAWPRASSRASPSSAATRSRSASWSPAGSRSRSRRELLAGRVPDVAFVALDDAVPRRALYALTPAAGVRPAATAFVAALAAALA